MTQLRDVINENMILLDCDVRSKEEIIFKLIETMDSAGRLSSREGFTQSVLAREELLSTFCGSGIAIPHGISSDVKDAGICFARVKEIGWDDPENKVRFVFLLAIPKNGGEQDRDHIKLLSAIAVSSLEEEIREKWARASTEKEIIESLSPALRSIDEGE